MAKKSLLGPKTEHLMSLPPKANPEDMVRKTHYLDGNAYEAFEKLCKKRGRSTSEIINSMIADFIEAYGR